MDKSSKTFQFTVAHPNLVTAATFALVGGAKYFYIAKLHAIGVPLLTLRAQDAIITGVLAATLVFVLLKASQRRRRQVAAQLQAVADLNHNVRNALEVIVGSAYLPEQQKVRAVLESVERIDQTLRGMKLFVEAKKGED